MSRSRSTAAASSSGDGDLETNSALTLFLVRSLNRNDQELASLEEIHTRLHALRNELEARNPIVLLELGRGRIRLGTATTRATTEDEPHQEAETSVPVEPKDGAATEALTLEPLSTLSTPSNAEAPRPPVVLESLAAASSSTNVSSLGPPPPPQSDPTMVVDCLVGTQEGSIRRVEELLVERQQQYQQDSTIQEGSSAAAACGSDGTPPVIPIYDVAVSYLLHFKLRRRLLNRLARRLLRVAHAMDTMKLPEVPTLPSYGDLRLHVDPDAVHALEQVRLEQERILLQTEKDAMTEIAPAATTATTATSNHPVAPTQTASGVAEEPVSTPSGPTEAAAVTDSTTSEHIQKDADREEQVESSAQTKQEEDKEMKDSAPGAKQQDTAEETKEASKKEQDAEEQQKRYQLVVSSLPRLEYQSFLEYKDAYEKQEPIMSSQPKNGEPSHLDDRPPLYTSALPPSASKADAENSNQDDDQNKEDYERIPLGSIGIGATVGPRSIQTASERASEFTRWKTALLSKIPDQPRLFAEPFVFHYKKRLALVRQQEQEKKDQQRQTEQDGDPNTQTPVKVGGKMLKSMDQNGGNGVEGDKPILTVSPNSKAGKTLRRESVTEDNTDEAPNAENTVKEPSSTEMVVEDDKKPQSVKSDDIDVDEVPSVEKVDKSGDGEEFVDKMDVDEVKTEPDTAKKENDEGPGGEADKDNDAQAVAGGKDDNKDEDALEASTTKAHSDETGEMENALDGGIGDKQKSDDTNEAVESSKAENAQIEQNDGKQGTKEANTDKPSEEVVEGGDQQIESSTKKSSATEDDAVDGQAEKNEKEGSAPLVKETEGKNVEETGKGDEPAVEETKDIDADTADGGGKDTAEEETKEKEAEDKETAAKGDDKEEPVKKEMEIENSEATKPHTSDSVGDDDEGGDEPDVGNKDDETDGEEENEDGMEKEDTETREEDNHEEAGDEDADGVANSGEAEKKEDDDALASGEAEKKDDDDAKNSDEAEKKEEDDDDEDDCDDPVKKMKRPILLMPTPSFYEQDMKRIKLIHAELMSTSIRDHARRRLEEVTLDYNNALRTSNALFERRQNLQAQLQDMVMENRNYVNQVNSDYQVNLAMARNNWTMRRREFEKHKLDHLMPQRHNNHHFPEGTALTHMYMRQPDPMRQIVAQYVGGMVDAITHISHGTKRNDHFREELHPPPKPDAGLSHKKRIEDQVRQEINNLTLQLRASEDERQRTWKKMMKTKAEFDLPHHHMRTKIELNMNNYHSLPLPPLRQSSTQNVPQEVARPATTFGSYVPQTRRSITSAPASIDPNESKYSAARVRQRIASDGTVAPVSVPKRTKDGLFQRPAGRTRKGMDWDAIRGIWVPSTSG